MNNYNFLNTCLLQKDKCGIFKLPRRRGFVIRAIITHGLQIRASKG